MPHPAFDLLDPADPDPGARRALRHWLELQYGLALEPQRAAEALRRLGDPRRVLHAERIPSTPARQLDAALAAARRARAVALPLLAPRYPTRLAQLSDPAPLLWVRGDVSALSAPGVALVGSRAATAYGLAVARRMARELAEAGLVVVSGLARGIDAQAHEGALEVGGRSVAFQACGPERVYPPEHAGLAARIAARGAVVTEHPPGAPPRKAHFPLRNRLLSGCALGLVVVEARLRSGSLISAEHAAHQDVDVFAVPGRVDAPTSAGPNRLLFQGAFVARDARDVVSRLEQRSGWRVPRRPRRRATSVGPAGEIVRALRHAPATRDGLAERLGRPPEAFALELLELELSGAVVEDRDGVLRVQDL